MAVKEINNDYLILLFDGVCNLCNSTVQFIIRHDNQDKFRFASLQSSAGQELLKKFNLPPEKMNSLVLIENEKYFLRSTAVLRVFKELGGKWKLLYYLIIIPAPIRDLLYRFISKTRYTIFGKRDSCMIPTENILRKFI